MKPLPACALLVAIASPVSAQHFAGEAGVQVQTERDRLQRHYLAFEIPKAVAAGARLAALDGHTGPDLISYARMLNLSGAHADAIAQLDAAEAKGDVRPFAFDDAPIQEDLWTERAQAHAALGDLARAEACALRAAQLEHASVYAHLRAARLAMVRGRSSVALKRLDVAWARCDDRHARGAVLLTRGLIKASQPATRAAAAADLLASHREDDFGETLAWHRALFGPGPEPTEADPVADLLAQAARGDLEPATLAQRVADLDDPWDRYGLRELGLALLGARAEAQGEQGTALYAACVSLVRLSGDAWWWSTVRRRG